MDLCQECHVCFKNVDRKVQGRSKRATLCIHGPRKSLRQGSAGRAARYCMRKSGIAEKYVQLVQDIQYMKESKQCGEVCCRNYRKFQGQGWTAPGISVKSVPVCSDNGQANG